MAQSNRRRIVVISLIIIVLGLAAVMYAMYSSTRNDADGAADRQTSAPATTVPKPTAGSTTQTKREAAADGQTGQQVQLKLYADSGAQFVNAVQADITYPVDSLRLQKVTSGSAFPNEFITNTDTPGKIKIVRAVERQSESVKGTNVVVTATFTYLKAVDPATTVKVDEAGSYLVTSSDNKNLISTGEGSLTIRR